MIKAGPELLRPTKTEPGMPYPRLFLLSAALSFIYGVITAQFGYGQPLSQWLGPPADLFGDYFKFILSFPGGDRVLLTSVFGLADLGVHVPLQNPYLGIEGLPDGDFTHLHGTPLMTLFCLLSIKAMQAIGGAGAFLVTYVLLGFYWVKVALGWARTRDEGAAWIVAGFLSYPFMMVVARGNIYAGVTGILLVHAMLLASRRSAPMLVAVLVATAVNIRPNAILFALPLALFYWPLIRRVAPIFCLAGGAICLVSLAFANALYPDYTIRSFLGALDVYYRGYVVKDAGLAAGSSLYGSLKFFLGYRPGLDFAALLPSLAILPLAAWGWITGRLSDAALLFLVAAAYCLGSSVIADYHLLIFVVPLMVLHEAQGGVSPIDRIAQIASVAMLLAKNFVYRGDVSYQVVLNPAVLLVASCVMLFLAFRARATSSSDHRLRNVPA